MDTNFKCDFPKMDIFGIWKSFSSPLIYNMQNLDNALPYAHCTRSGYQLEISFYHTIYTQRVSLCVFHDVIR